VTQLVDFVAKRIDVLEAAIDGGESHVRHFVETIASSGVKG